jgi:hypothetical protein
MLPQRFWSGGVEEARDTRSQDNVSRDMILLLGLFPIYESRRIRDDLKVRGTVLASITAGDPIRPGFEVNLYTFSYGPVCAPCAARTHTIKSET